MRDEVFADAPLDAVHAATQSVVGEPVKHLQARSTPAGTPGYCSRTFLAHLHVLTGSGHRSDHTVFVKALLWPYIHEAQHYQHLTRLGAPVARLHGWWHDGQGSEVLLLERLSRVDINTGSYLEVTAFLQAMAQLNATPVDNEYEAHLPTLDLAAQLVGTGADDPSQLLPRLWDEAASGHLGSQIQQLCGSTPVGALVNLAGRLSTLIAPMPTGVVHGDFKTQNVGWRPDDSIAIFDLHKIARGPRFLDLALLLDAAQPVLTGVEGPRQLVEAYHRQWSRAITGDEVSMEQVLHEATILSAARLFDLAWYIDRAKDGQADWTTNPHEGRRVFRTWLHQKLHQLTQHIGPPGSSASGRTRENGKAAQVDPLD